MALFQHPPRTPEEIERSKPLDIAPDDVLDMDEETWYAKVYRGDDVPQLTVRSVLLGGMLGFLLAFTNLYIGLKTGWGLGVAITASILAYGLWTSLERVGLAKSPMTILETNCMQSTASAAGYSTGGTMSSAIAALLMLSVTPANPGGQHLSWTLLASWTLALALLGTVIAIPMKRSLINHERLRFPSGVAAAVTLQSLYSKGKEALQKARALMWTAIFGAMFPLLLDLPVRNGQPLMQSTTNIFDFFPWLSRSVQRPGEAPRHFWPSEWTLTWDNNPVMVAAGMIVGMRISIWMTLAGLGLAIYLGPLGYEAAWVNATGQTIYATSHPANGWREVGLWLGVPIMLSSGLLSFALQWKTIVRALSGIFARKPEGTPKPAHQDTEVPLSWFGAGLLVAGAAVVFIADYSFDIPVIYGILAIGLTFLLALVAARATGESDITPVGAMGKLMQLTYGVLIPQSTTANLMTASITASSATSTADLLTDLKSGYLLGANPRRQFIAQIAGIIPGTIATVVGFRLLVPDASALLGTDGQAPKFPAPSAQAWKAVAEVFKNGIENMHPMHQQMIVLGLVIGLVAVALEQLLPRYRQWLPSATGLGLGFILPFQYPLSMLAGAVISWVWGLRDAQSERTWAVPIASGLIAGISIMGVLVAVIANTLLAG